MDPVYFREKEPIELAGNFSNVKRKLGWQPRIGFKEMIREMVESDFQLEVRKQKGIKRLIIVVRISLKKPGLKSKPSKIALTLIPRRLPVD